MSTPSFLSIKVGGSARERSSATYLLVSECALRARARSHWATKRFSIFARDLQCAAGTIAC